MSTNIDPHDVTAQQTNAEQAMGKLVTDSVAAVIDETVKRGDQPTPSEWTDRFILQFHNVPGFNEDEFRRRSSASSTIKEMQGYPDRGTAKLDEASRRAEQANRDKQSGQHSPPQSQRKTG